MGKRRPNILDPLALLSSPQKQLDYINQMKENIKAWAELGKVLKELTQAVDRTTDAIEDLNRTLKGR